MVMAAKPRKKKRGESICDKYRLILNRPDLTDKEIEEMRRHLGLLARTICEHVWGKKFY
jgi:hypothetical protein